MYNKITDPNTGLTYNINSSEAKELIKNYIIFLQTGGTGVVPLITAATITAPLAITVASGITVFALGSWIYNVYKCKEGRRNDKVFIAQLIPTGLTPYKNELPEDINAWINSIKGCDEKWIGGSESERESAAEDVGLMLGDFSGEQLGGAAADDVAELGKALLRVTLVVAVSGIYLYISNKKDVGANTTYDIEDLKTELKKWEDIRNTMEESLRTRITNNTGSKTDLIFITQAQKKIREVDQIINKYEQSITIIETTSLMG